MWLALLHGRLSSRVPGTERWNKAEVATSISEARGYEAETGSPGKLLCCLIYNPKLLTDGALGRGTVGLSFDVVCAMAASGIWRGLGTAFQDDFLKSIRKTKY